MKGLRAKDHIGKRFGRLTALSVEVRGQGTDKRSYVWCVCDCGTEKVIAWHGLRSGTQSCGCLRNEVTKVASLKHGHCRRSTGKRSRAYRTWDAMRDRCLNPRSKNYPEYGGAGITICDRWLESFENFLADMGDPPPGSTIDRKSYLGNYEPDNCRWATKVQQARNRSICVHINVFGVSMILADVVDLVGVHASTLKRRVDKGLSWQEAFDETIAQIAVPSSTRFARAPFGVSGVYRAQSKSGGYRVYKLGQRKSIQIGVFKTLEEAIQVARSINE